MKRRADGRYRRIVNGVEFYGKSEREVNRKILDYREKKEKGRPFREVADDWWREAFETLSHQTLKGYKPALERVIEHFGDISIQEIKPRDISAFYKILAAGDFAQNTVATHRIVINQTFKLALVNGEIEYNPCAVVPMPRGLKREQRQAAPEREEEMILSTAHDWMFPLFALLSGLRKGEILALKWGDIDFEANTISVTKSVEHIGNTPHIKAPKTAAGVRVVPLIDALKERIQGKCGDPAHFIFSDDGGKSPLTNSRFFNLYDEYRATVGIKSSSHQLRHSFATTAIEHDVNPRDLQGVLGHASSKITMERYAHYREKSVANVAEKMNAKPTKNAPKKA